MSHSYYLKAQWGYCCHFFLVKSICNKCHWWRSEILCWRCCFIRSMGKLSILIQIGWCPADEASEDWEVLVDKGIENRCGAGGGHSYDVTDSKDDKPCRLSLNENQWCLYKSTIYSSFYTWANPKILLRRVRMLMGAQETKNIREKEQSMMLVLSLLLCELRLTLARLALDFLNLM